MHERGVMHRDIKLDNIMLRGAELNQGKLTPIIVDFGLAEYIEARPYYYLKCGTPGFTAPEILDIDSRETNEIYDEKCDMFSFGIVAYIL
jgi:serine/threonine protein kinase